MPISAPLARLDSRGVEIRILEEVSAILSEGVEVTNVYSRRQRTLAGFDSVVLSCGGVGETGLFDELRARGIDAHILGDAYAPRRLVFATRQAYALARVLLQ